MADQGEQPSGKKPIPHGFETWNAYWTRQEMPWRTEPEIDEGRQRYLAERRAVQPDIESGIYPFRDEKGSIRLTRADVEWLLATHESDGTYGPLAWSNEGPRHSGLNVQGADLRSVDLRNLPLTCLNGGFLANQSSTMTPAQRDAAGVHMEGANLFQSQLEGANLSWAHLEGANLASAHLEAGHLTWGHLEGANLSNAYLAGANIRAAYFSSVSYLAGIHVTSKQHGSIRLAGVRWGGADLTVVDWTQLTQLGDEQVIRTPLPTMGYRARKAERLRRTEGAVRANRQLATALRGQGLNEVADHFAYRAQRLQQQVLRRQAQLLRWLGSLLLDITSGYGYKPMRSFITYLFVVVGFAAVYFALGGSNSQALPWNEALVVSMTAFHGRGFFGSAFQPGDVQAAVAAVEALVGLLIEIVFIATFTQRFFSR